MTWRTSAALLAVGILVLTGMATARVASAHANLINANIRNHEVFPRGRAPHTIIAKFAEELDPGKSWMAVFEGVADHGLVTDHEHSIVSFKRPRIMTLKLPKLRPERYYLIWYTRSLQDGHYAAGVLYFSVR